MNWPDKDADQARDRSRSQLFAGRPAAPSPSRSVSTAPRSAGSRALASGPPGRSLLPLPLPSRCYVRELLLLQLRRPPRSLLVTVLGQDHRAQINQERIDCGVIWTCWKMAFLLRLEIDRLVAWEKTECKSKTGRSFRPHLGTGLSPRTTTVLRTSAALLVDY
jgi:hypothetical protein